MPFPTVQNTIKDNAGNPVPNAPVIITLVGAPGFRYDSQLNRYIEQYRSVITF